MNKILIIASLLVSTLSFASKETSAIYLQDTINDGEIVLTDPAQVIEHYLYGLDQEVCYRGSAEEIIAAVFTVGDYLSLEETNDIKLTSVYLVDYGDIVIAFDYINVDDDDAAHIRKCY